MLAGHSKLRHPAPLHGKQGQRMCVAFRNWTQQAFKWVLHLYFPVFFCILVGKLLPRAAVREGLVIVIREYVPCVSFLCSVSWEQIVYIARNC